MKIILNFSGLLILMLFVNLGQAAAQEPVIVNGQIIDALTKEPVPGVNVVEINDMDRFLTGAITDFNGNFALKVKSTGNRIQFRFIGYKNITLEINQRTNFNLELIPITESIDEIAVTASKISNDGIVSIRDRTTSVSRIELSKLESVMTTSVEEMLQGRLAGVDISSISGDPGAGLNIRIRGTATLNGSNDPLIVVNGIPYNSDVDDDFDFSSADAEKFGNLIDVAPEDIESIEVLKDAASTAIWGSKAANGVLMIKTKRGMKSEPIFDYTFKKTIGWEPPALPMLEGGEYASLIQQMHYNVDRGEFYSYADYSEDDNLYNEIFYNPLWSGYEYFSQETDWVDEITKVSLSEQHTFSVRGGGDKARYKMVVGYSDEDGTTINNGLKKLTVSTSLDYDLSTKLRVLTDIMYTRYEQHNPYDSENDDFDDKGLRTIAYLKMPNMSVYEIDNDGNFIEDEYYTPDETLQGDVEDVYNPVAFGKLGVNEQLKNNARTAFTLKYQVLRDLSWSSTVTLDMFDNHRERFLPYAAIGGDYESDLTNLASDEYTKKTSMYTFNKLIYTPKLSDAHSFTLLGQVDTEKTSTRGEFQETNYSASEAFDDATGDKNITEMDESYSEYRSVGLFGMGYYKYKDKYLFNVGIKYEGNSKYSSGSRWGFFPTISGAWRMSEEPFMENITWIDDCKVRMSWGESGNAPSSNYLYWNTYNSSSSYSYMGVQGVEPDTPEYTSLQWEVIEQINPGISIYALKNRLNIEMDYYVKTTRNLYISGLGIPTSSGFSSISVNDGSMENKGFELSADFTVIKKKDFTVNFNFNISRNTNTVISLPENYALEYGDMLDNGNYKISVVPGSPLGGFFGYKFLGVYDNDDDTVVKDKNGDTVYGLNADTPLTMSMQDYEFQAGDSKYKDVNYDGEINELDLVYLGDLNPDLMGGVGCRVYYKGITFNSLFYFKVGQKVINETRMNTENMYDYDNQSAAVKSYWRSDGDDTDIPRPLYNTGYNWLGSSRFVEKGNYLRLKSVSLKYNFSKALLKKTGLGLSDASFYVTGYNLLTFTNYSGQDPDVSLPSDPDTLPTDDSKTPPSRRVIIGLNIKF